jgi:hypothetical protein
MNGRKWQNLPPLPWKESTYNGIFEKAEGFLNRLTRWRVDESASLLTKRLHELLQVQMAEGFLEMRVPTIWARQPSLSFINHWEKAIIFDAVITVVNRTPLFFPRWFKWFIPMETVSRSRFRASSQTRDKMIQQTMSICSNRTVKLT